MYKGGNTYPTIKSDPKIKLSLPNSSHIKKSRPPTLFVPNLKNWPGGNPRLVPVPHNTIQHLYIHTLTSTITLTQAYTITIINTVSHGEKSAKSAQNDKE